MGREWDAIVVGARCAGSPTAMLLAQKGYRVLLVDSAEFPSDTISTHLIHPPGIAALERWGLLGRLVETGCPPIRWYSYDFGLVTITGTPHDRLAAHCPRRTQLDAILLEAAGSAGAEVRQGFSVDEIVRDGSRVTGIRGRANGKTISESARVVIGADGRSSRVAKAVAAEAYEEREPVQISYYAYFADLPMEAFETYVRPYRGWAAMPTNDDLTVVIVGWPIAELAEYKRDTERNYFATFDLVPAFAERMQKAKRESRFLGTSVPGYFKKPFGDGWALIGDAGHNKDFIPAMGITDAFRDAESCSTALHEALSGERSFEEAMRAHQRRRDEQCLPMYDFTYRIAPLAPPPEDFQQLLAGMRDDPVAMQRFVRLTSGVLSPGEFFGESAH
jgi:2-polyprenyl-6-methoxyphenol hydroxylase-like FAD-dependent oxidoreductase